MSSPANLTALRAEENRPARPSQQFMTVGLLFFYSGGTAAPS